MNWGFKTRKSAGVPVTIAVHRLLQRANGARAAGDWAAAAALYAEALAAAPELYHIHVQLGHARKELDDVAGAEAAYRAAAALRPAGGEPHLHLGHLFKRAGDHARAGDAYHEAVRLAPHDPEAVTELHRQLQWSPSVDRARVQALIDEIGGVPPAPDATPAADDPVAAARATLAELAAGVRDPADAERLREAAALLDRLRGTAERPGDDRPALVFDASDLVSYYGHTRLPTGIQRVQIEVIAHALAAADREVRICCFTEGRESWLEVPPALFLEVVRASVRGNAREQPEWVALLARLMLTLSIAEPFEFPHGACLVNLGTSWWLQNYFLFVREAKARSGIRYIPFVHDFIPVMTPLHCVSQLTQDFISWAIGVFEHADHYLVNSEATKRDLLTVAAMLGHEVDPADVAVVRLDADFRREGTRALPAADLARWGLAGQRFVLMVSTIESRKGHAVAFDAWMELYLRHGLAATPRLVCVGNAGWLNDAVHRRLQQNVELASHVVMLTQLTDEELALLYRECLFTLYPSLYEGWGLPITEALSYGKAVVAADNSSLPEAGGDFAVYVETGNPHALAEAVERLAFDDGYRAAVEARIAAGFRPRHWTEIARQIEGDIDRLLDRDGDAPTTRVPQAKPGRFHPITRNRATRVWPGIGSAEIFRTGLGWLWPEDWGCWLRPGGGGLAIGVPAGIGAVRVNLLLRGLPSHGTGWRLRLEAGTRLEGGLGPGEQRWVGLEVLPGAGDVIRLHLAGDGEEQVRVSVPGQDRDVAVSLGLCGFFVCAAADATSRLDFVESAMLGGIERLSAYAERAPTSATETMRAGA